MEAARRDLDLMRSTPAAWPELRYELATDAGGDGYDANAVRRAKVLWALQYDRRADDLPLVRWLAGQEARCRSEADFQGMTGEIDLAGFLLAGYRRVEDVWLQAGMKTANFDTYCGYDQDHLVAAGVATTVAYVRDSTHADRDDVLEMLLDDKGEPWLTEDDVARWFDHKRSYFPADPAAESPLTWIARAKLAGDEVLAREWLDRWAAGRPRDKATLSQLHYQLADLGAFAEAAAALRESLVFAGTAWDLASAWQSLAGLEREAGEHVAAWEALRACRETLDGVDGWREAGLGRTYVEELFLLACSAAAGLAGTVFAEADRQAADVPRLPLVVLQSAVEAAERTGDRQRAEHYRQLRDAEQRRIGS